MEMIFGVFILFSFIFNTLIVLNTVYSLIYFVGFVFLCVGLLFDCFLCEYVEKCVMCRLLYDRIKPNQTSNCTDIIVFSYTH